MITESELNALGLSILTKAILMFGECEQFSFVGFKFRQDDLGPRLKGDAKKGYTVLIGQLAKNSQEEACFQLTHEVIHLLTPTSKENASVFEEGLAVHFSLFYLKEQFSEEVSDKYLGYLKQYPNYYESYKLLDGLPDLFTKVKILRDSSPNKISDWTVDEIISIVSDEELVTKLMKKFNYERLE